MSDEKIDVLAAMDEAAKAIEDQWAMYKGASDLVKARAAVAELIDAADRSIAQTRANQSDGLVPTIYYSAHQRLIAALARVRSS